MCIYVDDYDYEYEVISEGSRKARMSHQCRECNRVIDPGETYRFWVIKEDGYDSVETQKMCAHCWGTIELGAALTGCPKSWYWDEIHNDVDEEMGFVANILYDEGHDLSRQQQDLIRATVGGRKVQWRWGGKLLPIPRQLDEEWRQFSASLARVGAEP